MTAQRRLALLVFTAMVFFVCATAAFAGTTTTMQTYPESDYLRAEVSTERDDYYSGDIFPLTVTLTNITHHIMPPGSVTIRLPDQVEWVSGDLTAHFGSLAEGETHEFVVVVRIRAQEDPPPPPSDETTPTIVVPSIKPKTSAVATPSAPAPANTPKTGDATPLMSLMLCLLVAAGLIVAARQMRRRKTMQALIIMLAIGALLVVPALAGAHILTPPFDPFTAPHGITANDEPCTFYADFVFDPFESVTGIGAVQEQREYYILKGSFADVGYLLLPANATVKDVTVSCANQAIASVEKIAGEYTLRIEGLEVGDTQVVLETYDGRYTLTLIIHVYEETPEPEELTALYLHGIARAERISGVWYDGDVKVIAYNITTGEVFTTNSWDIFGIFGDDPWYEMQITPGKYEIEFSKPGYNSHWETLDLSGPIYVGDPREWTRLDATLLCGKGRLSGFALAEAGSSKDMWYDGEVTVTAYHHESGQIFKTISDWENFYWELDAFPGFYTIEFSKSGYVTEYSDIYLSPYEDFIHPTVILRRPGGGVVIYDGETIELSAIARSRYQKEAFQGNVKITAINLDDGWEFYATSDSNSPFRYTIAVAPGANYLFIFEKDGYVTQMYTYYVGPKTNTVGTGTVTLVDMTNDLTNVSGNASASGTPNTGGVTVSFTNLQTGAVYVTMSATSNPFKFSISVPAGPYRIDYIKDGFISQTRFVENIEGKNFSMDSTTVRLLPMVAAAQMSAPMGALSLSSVEVTGASGLAATDAGDSTDPAPEVVADDATVKKEESTGPVDETEVALPAEGGEDVTD